MEAKSLLPRHAVLIVAHENPSRLLRLVKRLAHDRIEIIIHLDQESNHLFSRADYENLGATVISTQRPNWGGFSICRTQLDLLRAAYEAGPFHTYSLISGSDYPVKPVAKIVAELDLVDLNLIDHWHDDNPLWHRRYARMYFYDYPSARLLNGLSRRLAKFLPDRKAPEGIKVYFGWLWSTLMTSGVEALFRFCEERPDVLKWYRFIHIPDESFVQTALMNVSDPPHMGRATHRYIVFPNASARPKFIGPEDYDEALSGKYWFARKFRDDRIPNDMDEVDRILAAE